VFEAQMLHRNQESIQETRRHLNLVRQALLSLGPEPLEQAVQQLELAVGCLRQVEREISAQKSIDADVRKEIASLKFELAVIERLAEQGLRLQAGWAAMLASALGGYTANGDTTPLAARSHVCVEG
jgi:hypothetical protein